MTAPVVVQAFTSRDDVSNTTQNATLPATITAGELLIALMWVDGSETITWDDSTAGAWTTLGSDYGTNISFAARYKIADGTEDGLTLACTTGGAQEAHTLFFRVTGYAASTFIEIAGTNIASASAKNPPNLAPAWGSADTLWITACGVLTGATPAVVTAGPTNYSGNFVQADGTNGGISLGYSWRANTAASEDPDSFTVSANGVAYVITIGIEPGAASSTITDVDTDETIVAGQTTVQVTGTELATGTAARIISGGRSIPMLNYDDHATSPTFDVPNLAALLAAGIKFGSVTLEIVT